MKPLHFQHLQRDGPSPSTGESWWQLPHFRDLPRDFQPRFASDCGHAASPRRFHHQVPVYSPTWAAGQLPILSRRMRCAASPRFSPMSAVAIPATWKVWRSVREGRHGYKRTPAVPWTLPTLGAVGRATVPASEAGTLALRSWAS